MQIRSLHRAIYRGARLASRLATQERSDVVERRDAVARWRQARRDGLTASQAAKAVGTPLSTLYRWAKDAPPKSRRPKTARKPAWTTKLVQAVEEWRLEEPTWGKAKIVVKLREEGFSVSEATVGRILAHLITRGAVLPVPAMRKAAKTQKWAAKRRFAERLPRYAKATRPGQIVQLDTVYVTLAPGKHVKHFTAQGRGHPGRWRLRVHGRVRGRLPKPSHQALRAAAQEPRDQRRGGALQRRVALRVLRRL